MLPQTRNKYDVHEENEDVVRWSTCEKKATAMDGRLIEHHHVFLVVEMRKPSPTTHIFFAAEKRDLEETSQAHWENRRMLASIYTYALLVLVLLATALPLFTEEWLERKLGPLGVIALLEVPFQ